MQKVIEFLKKNIMGIIIGGVLFGGIGIVIATSIQSEAILYSNEANENVATVEDALDDLYSKAGSNSGSSFLTSLTIGGTTINTVTITTEDNYNTIYNTIKLYDGVLYHHTSDTTADDYIANNAGDDSYRYSGPNPNNWVCFGYDRNSITDTNSNDIPDICESGTFSATSDNAYRIIGWFKDVDGNSNNAYYMKLIKATAYTGGGSTVAWNSSNSNTFSASPLFSTTLNGASGSYLSTLTSNGWNSYLAQPIWNVGGCPNASCVSGTANSAYTAEMVTSGSNSYGAYGTAATNNSYKIGLMYVNDYAYAVQSDYWTRPLGGNSSTDYRTLTSYNWMYVSGLGTEWTISRFSDYSNSSFIVSSNGNVSYDIVSTYSYAVRPVLYLASSTKINENTNGTVTSPYVLGI